METGAKWSGGEGTKQYVVYGIILLDKTLYCIQYKLYLTKLASSTFRWTTFLPLQGIVVSSLNNWFVVGEKVSGVCIERQ